MLDPGVGVIGVTELGDIGAVLLTGGGRDGINTIMAMHVDDARRHPTAVGINGGDALGLEAVSHRHDPAIANQHIAVVDALPRPIQNGRADNQRVGARQRLISTGIGIGRERQRNTTRGGRINFEQPKTTQRARHERRAPGTAVSHPALPATKRSFPSTTVRSTCAEPSCCGSIRSRSLSNTTRSARYPGTRRPRRSSWNPA